MSTTEKVQNYHNHAKVVPLYVYFVLPVLFANIGLAAMDAVRDLSTRSVVALLVAMALALTAVYARTFALKAQDRVIRLEMRLRLRELLPAELRPRIDEFTVDQLVALRFAGDEELPALASTTLRDDLRDRRTIKKMVRDWRADHARL
jgi:hypothetical protein